MSRFDKCPVNDDMYERTGKYCDNRLSQNCESCLTFLAYQRGRADATKEVLEMIKRDFQ